MHFEERMVNMGAADCDALSPSMSPKHPLSKSLRRSFSNRTIRQESPSLYNQALLQRAEHHHLRPPQPSSPKTLFTLQTTKSVLPPKPAKHLSRSLTFSCESETKNPILLAPIAEPEQARTPDISSKSFFRSSSFTGLREPKLPEQTSSGPDRRLSTGSPPVTRSASFSSRVPEKKDLISSFSKWARSFRSKPDAEEVIDIPESSPYSLLSRGSSPMVELENSFGVITKGILDSSRNAVKAMQDKAQLLLNKRYQDGGSHLDMVYITENIIALGFPDTDNSPNILGLKENNYRDYLEELIGFCEAQHPDNYKIFNLCSEKLYDTSLLRDKVACFPFQGNNCPPLQLVSAFCQAAYSWLKAGLENVVVVHCKGGMARTGLMVSCLLLHLKFFPTAEESVNHYNHKRCVDSNGLILPSHLRYVKYYEQVLRKHQGFTPTGRRCTLRSIRLINCPSWIRPAVTISDHEGVLFTSLTHPKTRSMLAEEVWLSALKSGVFLFELPDGGHAAAVDGDFKIHFQDHRNVEFSCWLNTNMMEGNSVLRVTDLDGYEKALQEAIGFQVELDLVDTYVSVLKVTNSSTLRPCLGSDSASSATDGDTNSFTDSDGEKDEGAARKPELEAAAAAAATSFQAALSNAVTEVSTGILNAMDRLGMNHLRTRSRSPPSSPRMNGWSTTTGTSSRFLTSKEALQKQFTFDFEAAAAADSSGFSFESCQRSEDPESCDDEAFSDAAAVVTSDFQALAAASAADASLFTFGDEEDYDSDEV